MSNRILVVDDDMAIIKMLDTTFQIKGHQVFSAHNGEEGLRKAYEVCPDVIILDVMMPKMSGYEVCQHLKNDPNMAGIPVIILSALGNNDVPSNSQNGSFFNRLEDRLRGYDSGAVEFLTKPIALKTLIERVEYWVRNGVDGTQGQKR